MAGSSVLKKMKNILFYLKEINLELCRAPRLHPNNSNGILWRPSPSFPASTSGFGWLSVHEKRLSARLCLPCMPGRDVVLACRVDALCSIWDASLGNMPQPNRITGRMLWSEQMVLGSLVAARPAFKGQEGTVKATGGRKVWGVTVQNV